MESWLRFYGTVMETIWSCDKQKCAGTDVHAGIFHLALCVISTIILPRPTSLDRCGPSGRTVIQSDGPYT